MPSQALREGWGFLRKSEAGLLQARAALRAKVGKVRGLDSEVKRQRQMSGVCREGCEGKSRPSPQRATCRLRRDRLCARDQLTPKCVLHQNGDQARLTNGNFT